MKRDLDFTRAIMLDVENRDQAFSYACDAFEGKPFNELAYHVEMLIHKGFIDGKVEHAWSGDAVNIYVKALTWDGVDFLDAIRSEKVWTETKTALFKSVGETTFDVVKRLACEIATKLVIHAITIH